MFDFNSTAVLDQDDDDDDATMLANARELDAKLAELRELTRKINATYRWI